MAEKLHIQQNLESRILNPPFNDISPFFSAVIYRKHEEIDLNKVLRFSKIECDKENRDSTRHYYYFNEEYLEDSFGVFTICQKSIPTWLTSRRISRDRENFQIWEDFKTHLIIVYQTEHFFFLSCKEAKVLGFFQLALSKIDSSVLSLVEKKNFQKVKAFKGDKAKIIGLKNTFGFGGGGRIPESKSYTGRDCSRSLNGMTDHVFRLSHLGSTDEEDGYSGASVKKRKVWGGWTSCLVDFLTVCDKYADSLTEDNENEQFIQRSLKCLAQPSSIDNVRGKKPILFQISSWVKGRGLVGLRYKDFSVKSWDVEIPQYAKDKIIIRINLETGLPLESVITFDYDDENKINFEYHQDNENELNVVFFQEEENEPRGRDLIRFLNRHKEYTLLFPGGIAYSDGDFYVLDKLNNSFFGNSEAIINWSKVDITKEEAVAAKPRMNILEKLEDYVKKMPNVYFAANDNGANEVADLVILSDNTVAFVHAKASKTAKPALRIGDLQVVASQAVKNVNFVIPAPYSTNQVKRLYNNSIHNPSEMSFEEFQEAFFGSLEDINVKKEIWIVQPGISKEKLEANPDNKAHTLLSYTELALNSAQIDFRLICSG